jgi:branched-chain amino acid transport system ATP-binding protein
MTVLFVEHDMDIVARYADRVIAFASGRVIADARRRWRAPPPVRRRLVTGTLRTEAPC